jgi:hypothetical protein
MEVKTGIHLRPQERYGFHYDHFHEIQGRLTILQTIPLPDFIKIDRRFSR